jgi:hypothetical protein
MPNELIKFWQQCKLDKPPFAHPNDLPILGKNDGKFIHIEPMSFCSFIASPRFGDSEDKRLHLSLLPVPYLGDLDHATIVILDLNPGLEYTDYWAETKMPALQRRLMDNLQQSFEGVEFPFLFLDPEFCWHTGFIYWEKRLRSVIKRIAAKEFKNSYFDALRDLSRKLAYVELVPYHSCSFDDRILRDRLASVQRALDYARKSLIPDAIEGKRTLIVPRHTKVWTEAWGSPPNNEYLVVYPREQAQAASLGPNSPGGEAILRSYGVG